MPHTTNAGFLFYDASDAPSRRERATWSAVYDTARRNGAIAYQTSPPEALTVTYLELAFAAGGRVLSRDGARSVIDSPPNRRALAFMVDGIREHAVVPDILDEDLDESRDRFAQGATFMRNWPDNYKLLGDRGGNRFGVTALPIFDGAGVAGVLGEANLVIDSRSDNPGGRWR